jgi:hypothetical protein
MILAHTQHLPADEQTRLFFFVCHDTSDDEFKLVLSLQDLPTRIMMRAHRRYYNSSGGVFPKTLLALTYATTVVCSYPRTTLMALSGIAMGSVALYINPVVTTASMFMQYRSYCLPTDELSKTSLIEPLIHLSCQYVLWKRYCGTSNIRQVTSSNALINVAGTAFQMMMTQTALRILRRSTFRRYSHLPHDIVFSIERVFKAYTMYRYTNSLVVPIIFLSYNAYEHFLHGYQPIVETENIYEEADCPICISEAKDPVKLKCDHIFCKKCIEDWAVKGNTCPMCRDDMKVQSFADICWTAARFISNAAMEFLV